MVNNTTKLIVILFIGFITLSLSGCSGGSADTPPPSVLGDSSFSGTGGTEDKKQPETPDQADLSWPDIAVRYRPRSIILTWPPAPGATHYRIVERREGTERIIKDQIAGNEYVIDIAPHLFDWSGTRFRVDAVTRGGGVLESRPVGVESGRTKTASVTSLSYAMVNGSNSSTWDRYTGYSNIRMRLSGDGSTLVVGIPNENGDYNNPSNNKRDYGAAYIYRWQEDSKLWKLEARLLPPSGNKGNTFGWAVDISYDGNIVAISEPGEDGGGAGVNPPVEMTAGDAGAVHLYRRHKSGWKQVAYIKSDDPIARGRFGHVIDLSDDGKKLLVGEYGRLAKGPFGPNGTDRRVEYVRTVIEVQGKFYFYDLSDLKSVRQSAYFVPNVYSGWKLPAMKFSPDNNLLLVRYSWDYSTFLMYQIKNEKSGKLEFTLKQRFGDYRKKENGMLPPALNSSAARNILVFAGSNAIEVLRRNDEDKWEKDYQIPMLINRLTGYAKIKISAVTAPDDNTIVMIYKTDESGNQDVHHVAVLKKRSAGWEISHDFKMGVFEASTLSSDGGNIVAIDKLASELTTF